MARKQKAEFEIHATDKSKRGIARAEKNVGRLEKRMKGLARVAGGALAAIGGAAAARSFGRLVQNSNTLTDALAKQSRMLGVSIESLQSYRLQAQLTGTSNEALDKSILKLNRNTGDLVNGLVTSASTVPRAFEAIGLTVDDLRGKKPEEVFEAVVDGIQALPTPAERASIAMQLFGRSGSEMLNLIAEGGAGLRKAREDIVQMGLAIDEIDARKVEIANDELTRLEHISQAVKQRIGIELTPVIFAFTNALVESGREGEGFSTKIADGVEKVVVVFDRVVSAGSLMKNSVVAGLLAIGAGAAGLVARIARLESDFLGKISGLLRTNAEFLQRVVGGVASAVESIINVSISSINRLIGRAVAGLNILVAGVNKIPGVDLGKLEAPKLAPVKIKAPDIELIADGLEIGAQARREFADEADAVARGLFEEAEAAGTKAVEAFENLTAQDGGPLVDKFRAARKEIDALAAAAGGNTSGSASSTGTGGGAAGALKKAGKAGKEAAEEIELAWDPLAEKTTALFQNMEGAIDQFVDTGKLNFKEFADSVIKDLIRIELRSQILGGLFGVKNFGGGGFGSSPIGSLFKSLPFFDGGGFTGSGARSGGVDGKGGFPAILHPNETVVDHTRGQRGGGDTINVPVTVYVTETMPEGQVRQVVEAAKAGTLNAIRQIKQRGGSRALAY